MKQERRQKIVIIGIAAAALIAILGGIVYVQFIGKPLAYQYENVDKEVQKIATTQETATSSVSDYYRAAAGVEGVQPPSVDDIRSNVKVLGDQTEKLGKQPGVFKDENLMAEYENYKKAVDRYVADVYDIADSLEVTEAANKACSGKVTKAMETESNKEARKTFKPCLEAVLGMNLSEVSDADYKALFIAIRKVYNDYDKALGEGEGIEKAREDINRLSSSAREVDTRVQQRLEERIYEMKLGNLSEYVNNQLQS